MDKPRFQRCHVTPKPDPALKKHLNKKNDLVVTPEIELSLYDGQFFVNEDVVDLKKISNVIFDGERELPYWYVKKTVANKISTIFISDNGQFLSRLDPKNKQHNSIKQLKLSDEKKLDSLLGLGYQAIYNDYRYLSRCRREGKGIEDVKAIERKFKILLTNYYLIDSIESFVGNLGRARWIYYSTLPKTIIYPGWTWEGIDSDCPLAKMFKFAYSYLENLCLTAVMSQSLSPSIGFWHGDRTGGLVGDLMLNFKLLGDRSVLACINRAQVTIKDFVRSEGILNGNIRAAIIKNLNQNLDRTINFPVLDFKTSQRELIGLQALQYRLLIEGKIDIIYFITQR